MKDLIRKGYDFDIVVLEEHAEGSSLHGSEMWWIAYGRACEWPLTNITNGGEGTSGWKMTEETRAKIAATRKTRSHTYKTTIGIRNPEAQARGVATRKANLIAGITKPHKLTAETRARQSASKKGWKPKDESLARGWETRHARSAAGLYKKQKLSPEGRAKLVEGNLRRWAAWRLAKEFAKDDK